MINCIKQIIHEYYYTKDNYYNNKNYVILNSLVKFSHFNIKCVLIKLF